MSSIANTMRRLSGSPVTKHYHSETVTYIRRNRRISVSALIDETQVEEHSNEGITVRSGVTSFRIYKTELKLDGQSIEPQRGDQILRASGELLTVMPGETGAHWEWSDGHRNQYLIHMTIDEQG